ncbi:MAG: hypothetical protein IKG47_06555 [Oscillospiraceae bacterium]|nr:hypothetical protein [Oscillospiraceae bacterium]
MFGFRSDGKNAAKEMDIFTRITPYIMPTRVDAQNFNTVYIDEHTITEYVREKRAEGRTMSTLAVIIAAYVRAVANMPEMNRFVVGRRVYARNYLSVCFVAVHQPERAKFEESNAKIYFSPRDTVFDVADKVEEAIAKIKATTKDNKTTQLANKLLGFPGLLAIGVPILKLMDHFGILPKAIIDASPFHTSMFITNMASIRLPKLYHHIYNFGTVSQFFSIGEKEKQVEVDRDGNISVRTVYPLGIVTDERVASGSFYSMGFREMGKCLKDPHIMENPPETVRFEAGVEY